MAFVPRFEKFPPPGGVLPRVFPWCNRLSLSPLSFVAPFGENRTPPTPPAPGPFGAQKELFFPQSSPPTNENTFSRKRWKGCFFLPQGEGFFCPARKGWSLGRLPIELLGPLAPTIFPCKRNWKPNEPCFPRGVPRPNFRGQTAPWAHCFFKPLSLLSPPLPSFYPASARGGRRGFPQVIGFPPPPMADPLGNFPPFFIRGFKFLMLKLFPLDGPVGPGRSPKPCND